jgi:ribosome-associated translation inhibitor RaiA
LKSTAYALRLIIAALDKAVSKLERLFQSLKGRFKSPVRDD